MANHFRHSAWALYAVLLCAGPAFAQDWVPQRDYHTWSEFPVGTWKQVEVQTVAYASDGKVANRSVTQTRTILEGVDSRGVTLRVEVAVVLNGKRFASKPQVVRQQFGKGAGGAKIGEDILTISGQPFKVDVHEVVVNTKDRRRVTRLYLAEDCNPYVLQRVTVATDGDQAKYRTNVRVTKPYASKAVLGQQRSVWFVEAVHRQGARKTTTDEVHCLEVPGGLVEHQSRELDKNGQLVRQSKLELVGYGIGKPSGRRRRARRRR